MSDFNIHVNKDNRENTTFQDLLTSYSLEKHCNFPTHTLGNTLDLVITPQQSTFISNITRYTIISEHYALIFKINVLKPPHKPSTKLSFGPTKSIDTITFIDTFHSLTDNLEITDFDFDKLNHCLTHDQLLSSNEMSENP